ncbi:MAG: hypothetical protein AAGB10_06190 [Pseudomonadota bacterium]
MFKVAEPIQMHEASKLRHILNSKHNRAGARRMSVACMRYVLPSVLCTSSAIAIVVTAEFLALI